MGGRKIEREGERENEGERKREGESGHKDIDVQVISFTLSFSQPFVLICNAAGAATFRLKSEFLNRLLLTDPLYATTCDLKISLSGREKGLTLFTLFKQMSQMKFSKASTFPIEALVPLVK